MKTPAVSRILLTSATAAAAVLLTACSGSSPIEHGTVKMKRGHDAYTTPDTNCRNLSSHSFTLSLSPARTSGRGRGSGSSSGSRTTPKTPQKNPGSQNGGKSTTRRVCRPVLHPAVWELKLQDGKRSGWKKVSKELWGTVNVGDKV